MIKINMMKTAPIQKSKMHKSQHLSKTSAKIYKMIQMYMLKQSKHFYKTMFKFK